MEEKIKKIVKYLNICFYSGWAGILMICVLFEIDLLPEGLWVGYMPVIYIGQSIAILASMAVIPFALKLFSLKLTKTNEMGLEPALHSYIRWANIRLFLLFASALIDMLVYYFTMETAMFFCALMVLATSLYCVPSEKRLRKDIKLDITK